MLSALRVKNFILMPELELTLEPGLNVLTGETGAGKSIVVGALGLVLGGRASGELVRPGADEAEIDALFDLSDIELARTRELARLAEAGSLPGAELALRRVISKTGRSRAYLNGRLTTTAELAAVAAELADVASQHESVALTDPATHLLHLDRFARLDAERIALTGEVLELEALVARIDDLQRLERSRAEREGFLTFQLKTIDDVAPRAGELDELNAERRRLRHGERLGSLVRRAADRLDAEQGLCDELARVGADLRAAADLDPSLEPLARVIEGVLPDLRDCAGQASRYAEAIEVSPERLHEVEERLYRIEGLLRQHGPALDDVLASRERIAGELTDLQSAESRLEDEERALAARLPAVARLAQELSKKRKAAAENLGAAISEELHGLGMGGARVHVEVAELAPREARAQLIAGGAKLGREGIDRVEFLIAPNKGIEPRPLRKIASGGELSRALLALKRVLAESGPAGLYVFDEVDTGVGGAVAERIGAAIADVARHHQVLCITHLAPIAAFADAHYCVEKAAQGELAASSVRKLKGDDQVREVARMLSGSNITRAALTAAEEMLAFAKSSRDPQPRATRAPAPSKRRR
ncbi:MAG: DNA repair protein RecN [Polyangiaceae bacterium]